MKTRLKEARKASGMYQQDAADALGVSIGTYRNWEQGRVVMNGEQLVNAATLFGTDVDFILMMDAEPLPDTDMQDELVDIYQSLDEEGRRLLLDIARCVSAHHG